MTFDPAKFAEHVNDANGLELPFGIELHLPRILGFQLTKFMVLELLAAVLMVVVFVPLARRLARGDLPKGRFWNLFEALVLFVRDGIARPGLGRKEATRFLPVILTMFFFILFCNLAGMFPWMGSPTATINVTGPLALVTFCVGVGAGMKKYGVLGFWAGLCPPMDVPVAMRVILTPMMIVLETFGLIVRYGVLAVRLLANMFGGHLGLAVLISFISMAAGSVAWYLVAPTTMLVAVAINMLELFIAVLQAYVFSFLAALFIGMAVHRH
jgi:F-type H+-transporting ATPase subunit a